MCARARRPNGAGANTSYGPTKPEPDRAEVREVLSTAANGFVALKGSSAKPKGLVVVSIFLTLALLRNLPSSEVCLVTLCFYYRSTKQARLLLAVSGVCTYER